MQTPDNKAGQLTERIMRVFSKFNSNCILELETSQYNRVYGHVYAVLDNAILTSQPSGQETPVIVGHPPICPKCMKCHWPDVSCR